MGPAFCATAHQPFPAPQEPDRQLFVSQFRQLAVIGYYSAVRDQLRSLQGSGLGLLVRIEREMIAKVRFLREG